MQIYGRQNFAWKRSEGRNVWEAGSWTLLRRNAKIHCFGGINVEESSYPLLRMLF